MQVLVSRGDDAVASEVRQMIVRDGLLAPLLATLHRRGLDRKAITALTCMATVRCSLLARCGPAHGVSCVHRSMCTARDVEHRATLSASSCN